uniref:Metalloendopeptidase n=1 Tax=Panagrolaimus sp. PS1159 TaxID=55785 RepID=A0AC35G4G8_9BILA
MKQFILFILFAHFLFPSLGQISALFHSFTNSLPFPAYNKIKPDPLWIQSGKFQGDIDGIDSRILNHLGATVMLNALKNKQLTWTDGNVPYEMDDAFSNSRCYSQVGRTGGKQELSLGRGCLFHEIIVHELMHSLGFWHEHSRIDRDDHIRIKWENILPGMKSQFDIISGALQDTLGENYDYRSIMHYDSTAFSRNGQNTIETMVDGFTGVIGSATDLSDLDVVKIEKLYRCSKKDDETKTTLSKKKTTKSSPTESVTKSRTTLPPSDIPFSSSPTPIKKKGDSNKCSDQFLDCPNFKDYCKKVSFFFVMKAYCPFTCNHCRRE